MSTPIPSAATLRRAIEISERIEKLEAELRAVLAGSSSSSSAAAAAPKAAAGAKPAKKRRKMSPEARARIVAAQKLRWATVRAEKAAAATKK
jgi:hypothetical protein